MATASANPMPTKPLVAIVSPERIRLTASGADRILPSGLCAICRAGAAFVCMSRLDQKRDAATQHWTNASGEIPSPGARHHCSCINTRGHRVRKKRDLIYVPELLPASPGAPTASLSQPLARLWPEASGVASDRSKSVLLRRGERSTDRVLARGERRQCQGITGSLGLFDQLQNAGQRLFQASHEFAPQVLDDHPGEKPPGWLMRGKCGSLTARGDGHVANMKRVAAAAHERDSAPNRGT